MENIFIEFLPPWVETGLQPAFYDKESGTVLQQISRMYPKINELIKSNNKIASEFVTLQKYVHDYFDNLDVQDEINHKLDDMADSGELAEIISIYLNSNAILAYNTVAGMASAENLQDGSFAKTYGKLAYNDGNGKFYKIRELLETDVIDGFTKVALHDPTLVAEMMYDNTINSIESEIAKLDNITDYKYIVASDGSGDYTSVTDAVANASDGDAIFIKNGSYNNEVVDARTKTIILVGESRYGVNIRNSYDDYSRAPLMISKGLVKNLSIQQTGNSSSPHSYAIHSDYANLAGGILHIENVSMQSASNAGIGIGLKPNSVIVLDNCDIKGVTGIFAHPDNAYGGQAQNLWVRNCQVTGTTNGISLQGVGTIASNSATLLIQNTNVAINTPNPNNYLVYSTYTDSEFNFNIANGSSNNYPGVFNYNSLPLTEPLPIKSIGTTTHQQVNEIYIGVTITDSDVSTGYKNINISDKFHGRECKGVAKCSGFIQQSISAGTAFFPIERLSTARQFSLYVLQGNDDNVYLSLENLQLPGAYMLDIEFITDDRTT